jgi:hypothetical protein
MCPAAGIQQGGAGFEPTGIILTSFDRTGIWVYQVDGARRYPLPETRPCDGNCRLSPDARWLTYFNDETNAYNRMHLDGSERTYISAYASDIEWWTDNIYLIWTPGHNAYLMPEGSDQRTTLDVNQVVSIQPGGYWGVSVQPTETGFSRSLINLDPNMDSVPAQTIELGEDRLYFDAAAWSPSGDMLAFVAPVLSNSGELLGSEIYGISPDQSSPEQWTNFSNDYGLVRINGLAAGELSWSPDGSRIAFWVIQMLSNNPQGNLGNAILHVLDVPTRTVTTYCDYATTEHTPNPPRLRWSPDGTHIAFAGNIPADERGYLLLVLDTTTGVYTELSEGIYPALGAPNVIAWGLPPNQ